MIRLQDKSKIKFLFIGDMLLGDEYIKHAHKHHIDLLYPFRKIQHLLDGTDVLLINIEGPLYKGYQRRQGVTVHLSNNLKLLEILKKPKVCICNIANNHIFDFGYDAFKKTKDILDKNGIFYIGAGKDINEANEPLIIEYKKYKIGILAFTSDESHVGSIIAGKNTIGCASYLDFNSVIKQIIRLKKNTDFVCVSMHWGHEYFSYPSIEQMRMAHEMVDAGANFVIGHHPHVIQGVERYKDSMIIYSLGNLFFPPIRSTVGRIKYPKEITKEFLIVQSSVQHTKPVQFEIYGGKVQNDYTIAPYQPPQKEQFKHKIKNLSAHFQSLAYEQFWSDYRFKRENQLKVESLCDAVRKLFKMSIKEVVKTFTFDDITRNIQRIIKIFSKANREV